MSHNDKGNMHNMRITSNSSIPQRNDIRPIKKSSGLLQLQVVDSQLPSYDSQTQDKMFMMKAQANNYHQSNLQQFAQQQILNGSMMNKSNLNDSRQMPNKLDSSFQISRIHDKSAERVKTNINNLTSDFDLSSPLSNNTHQQTMKRNAQTENNTIDIKKNGPNVLDCSTLSTHSINELTQKRDQSRPMSKAALHYVPQDSPNSTANKGNRRRVINASGEQRVLAQPNMRLYQSPQNHSFLGGPPNAPQYDENLAKSNMSILNSMGGTEIHTSQSNYAGISSPMNRKEKSRIFHKKDLQLQTTIRKGKNSQQQTYLLSPDQIKFNQENLQKRFEEEEIILEPRRNGPYPAGSQRKNSTRDQLDYLQKTQESEIPRDFIYDMPITSATGDLSGIGLLSQSLMQSNEADQYLSNSSVAKTAALKRRNISVGLGKNAPERDGLDTAQNLNSIQSPNINNTYDGTQQHYIPRKESRGQEKYPNYIEELMQNTQRQYSQFNSNQNQRQPGLMNDSYNINNLIQTSKNAQQDANNQQSLIQRLQSNIHDANPSYLLQKQMNSSRFGGFRTADGASSGTKNQYQYNQTGQSNAISNNYAHGPQSPQSNQSFRVNVENRRARPKIVKTSQDHGNMFFIQQANSMKNSSQIGQRKDMFSKMYPYKGDTTSQGGTTSATTAVGNQDSHENRSGHSGHENPNNISGNPGHGAFVGDNSHHSVSDNEKTPTSKEKDMNKNKLLQMDPKKQGGEKQKDPYYFTFFNEKNEKKSEAGDNTPNVITDKKLVMPNNQKAFARNSMITTDNSQENFPSALSNDNQPQKKTIPTKPQFKKKLDTRTETSALSNHNALQQSMIRESYNHSQISQNAPPEDEEYLKIQKQAMTTGTPQKDVGHVKSKFDSSKESGIGYQTLDQDTRRVSRPIRGNHHTVNNNDKAEDSNYPFNQNINNKLQEPTPSFNSQKQQATNAQQQQDESTYTPVRRNPQITHYQRSKPQSPKIMLPQCFLDQPLNQASTAMNKKTRNAISKVHPEITPTNLRTKSETFQKNTQQRENYVRQSELQSRIGVLIEDPKKYNRGSSITPNLRLVGASNELFSSQGGRNVLSNQNSSNEVETSYDMKAYMNNIGLSSKPI